MPEVEGDKDEAKPAKLFLCKIPQRFRSDIGTEKKKMTSSQQEFSSLGWHEIGLAPFDAAHREWFEFSVQITTVEERVGFLLQHCEGGFLTSRFPPPIPPSPSSSSSSPVFPVSRTRATTTTTTPTPKTMSSGNDLAESDFISPSLGAMSEKDFATKKCASQKDSQPTRGRDHGSNHAQSVRVERLTGGLQEAAPRAQPLPPRLFLASDILPGMQELFHFVSAFLP